MKNKVPVTLIVLAVLSWIWMIFRLGSAIFSVFSGPMTDADIRKEKLDMLKGQTAETIELLGPMLRELSDIQEIVRSNLYMINGISIFAILLGILGVVFMVKLKKIGFYLYIIYSLLILIIEVYFFNEFSLGIITITISAILSGLFIFLYSRQLKHLS